ESDQNDSLCPAAPAKVGIPIAPGGPPGPRMRRPLSQVGGQLRPGLTRKRGGLVKATGSRTTTSRFSRRSTAFVACSAEILTASAKDSSLTPRCSNSVLLSASHFVVRAAFSSISALSRCAIFPPFPPPLRFLGRLSHVSVASL